MTNTTETLKNERKCFRVYFVFREFYRRQLKKTKSDAKASLFCII